jgi:hypothetical protein
MRSNFLNIGNNLPAGYDESGNRETWGLPSRYNSKIAAWEKANEAELSELENLTIREMKYPDSAFDVEFNKRLEFLKSKFPKQYNYFGKKYWK